MAAPLLDANQIQSLREALKRLDDVDVQLASAEKAGLDVASQRQQSQAHRAQINKMLAVYAPTTVTTTKRA